MLQKYLNNNYLWQILLPPWYTVKGPNIKFKQIIEILSPFDSFLKKQHHQLSNKFSTIWISLKKNSLIPSFK